MKPPEPLGVKSVAKWLEKAEGDLALARHLLEEGLPFQDAVGFHAQQAAEKFLKAVLVHRNVDFPKTHDLDFLAGLVAACDAALGASLPDLSDLTEYSVDTRYPDDLPSVTIDEAQDAVSLATRVQALVTAHIEKGQEMKVEVRKPTKAEADRVKAEKWGIWEKEISEFPYEYDEQETCLIIEGEVTVTCADGASVKFGAGDWVVFPQGLHCTWKITKPVRKYYRFG